MGILRMKVMGDLCDNVHLCAFLYTEDNRTVHRTRLGPVASCPECVSGAWRASWIDFAKHTHTHSHTLKRNTHTHTTDRLPVTPGHIVNAKTQSIRHNVINDANPNTPSSNTYTHTHTHTHSHTQNTQAHMHTYQHILIHTHIHTHQHTHVIRHTHKQTNTSKRIRESWSRDCMSPRAAM